MFYFSKQNSNVGACMRLLLGAKSMIFGCISMERLGAKYAVVGRMFIETFGCTSMPFVTYPQVDHMI